MKEEKSRSDIRAAERHGNPSAAPSHPISSISAHRPLCRPYLNNNCAQSQACRPGALPSVHQTSSDWVHLVPCDAFSQSLIYKEINGLPNNKSFNAQISVSLPHPYATQFIPMQVTNEEPRSGHHLLLLPRPADELQTPDWPRGLSSRVVIQAPGGRSEL